MTVAEGATDDPAPGPSTTSMDRDTRLDVLRGLGAVAVVIGHAILSVYRPGGAGAPLPIGVLFTLVSAFGLPTFMFVAGRLARPERGRRWLVGRIWRLVVPYFGWAFVQWLIWFRSQGLGFFIGAATNPSTTNALWFLYAMFIMSAILVLARGDDRVIAVLALASVVLPWADQRLFAFSYVATWFPVFATGYLTRKVRLDPGLAWLGVFVVSLLLLWAEPGSNLMGGSAPDWIIRIARAGLLGADLAAGALLKAARVLLAVSAVLAGLWSTRWLRSTVLGWLGVASLGVYCAHIIFVSYQPPAAPAWVFILAAVGLAGSAGTIWLLRRSECMSIVLLGSGPPHGRRVTG